jgi:small subunit ribosomal protein S6
LEVFDLKTATKKLYEGMFLVDSAEAAQNWDGVNENVKRILERSGAEILSIRKWDERKLAYEIHGKTRGTYILSYFRADGERIRDIEKDVQLSERIMRVLILSAETMNKEDIEKETPATKVEKQREKAVEEAEHRVEAKREAFEGAAEDSGAAADVEDAGEESEEISEPIQD